MMRVSGNSMRGAGINDKDVIIVDRSKEALPGKIVVAVLDGELTVKRLEKSKKMAYAPEISFQTIHHILG
jgi:DNA polymerase V